MPHPISPLIMSVHVSPVASVSHYQPPTHTRNPSHSHVHLDLTIPSSPHTKTMSLHTLAYTPISPRVWPIDNILDDLEKWQVEEENELIAIDADRDEMEQAKTKEENSNKEKDKSMETPRTPRRISRLFRAISPRTSPATNPSPSPSPSSFSPHLIPVKHSASVPIPVVAPTAPTTITPITTITPSLLLSPTESPERSLSSSPQPSPRQSPQPSPHQSPSTTPRAPLDGRPPTPRRSVHRSLKSPRMYLDEFHYLQHNPPIMKRLENEYQIVDKAVTQVPIHPVVTSIKKKDKKRHVPSSAPSSPCQTPTRQPSSSHSKTPPPPRSLPGRLRGAIRMLPSEVQPRSHSLIPSPMTLPRQTISEPSPIHAPALPTFHPAELPSTPKLPPIPESTSRIAPPLPSLPASKPAPPPVPTWTRRESATPSMPSIHETVPELKQVYIKRSEEEIIPHKRSISIEHEKPKSQPLRKGESSLAATIAAINRATKAS